MLQLFMYLSQSYGVSLVVRDHAAVTFYNASDYRTVK